MHPAGDCAARGLTCKIPRMSKAEHPHAGSAPPLGDMSAEEFRRCGREVVDCIAGYLAHPESRPVLAQVQPGELRSLLSAAFVTKAMLWRTSPASSELEMVALDWLRQLMGLPAEFEGIIYDTASVASLHAIAAAREALNLRVREDGMSGRPDLPLLRL